MLVGGVVLIASHVIFFNRLRHAGVSLAVVSGRALLVIAKHLGVVGSLLHVDPSAPSELTKMIARHNPPEA